MSGFARLGTSKRLKSFTFEIFKNIYSQIGKKKNE